MNNPILGVIFHWLGGLASGSFYVPFKGVRKWSWETYWLVGGFFSWLIAPWFFALLKTSDVVTVLRETPGDVWFHTYIFGLLWGFGGLTFGLTMRYLGMSLGMAVALGYCTVFGTLIPPIYKGEFAAKLLHTLNGQWVLAGLGVCVLGIVITAFAGHTKEGEMSEEDKRETVKEFDFKKGLLVATFSGVMSACFAFGLSAGDHIRETTLKVDMVNSAKKEGKEVKRTEQPSAADTDALLRAVAAEKAVEAGTPFGLADLTGLIERPSVISRKLADLSDSKTPDEAAVGKLRAEQPLAEARAKAAIRACQTGGTELGKRVVDYADRLSRVSRDPKVFPIVQEMTTLAEKETALGIHEAGADLPAIHDKHSLWTGLPVLIVVLLGGFTTNFLWCVMLNIRNRTGYQYFASHVREEHAHHGGASGGGEHGPAGKTAAADGPVDLKIPVVGNYIFSAVAGTTWYFQFFFYSMGETQMGQYKFSSWTLHMASIIIFSSIWGLAMKEWKGSSPKARGLLFLGLAVLVTSTLIVGYGNYLGSKG